MESKKDSVGYITFINIGSNKALDVNNSSASNGTNIRQYDYNNSYAQNGLRKRIQTVVLRLFQH